MSSPMGLLLALLPSGEEEGGEARLGGRGSGHGALGLWPLQAPFSELLYLWLQTPRAWRMRPTTCSAPLLSPRCALQPALLGGLGPGTLFLLQHA